MGIDNFRVEVTVISIFLRIKLMILNIKLYFLAKKYGKDNDLFFSKSKPLINAFVKSVAITIKKGRKYRCQV